MKKLLFIVIVLCLLCNIWAQTTKNITFTSVLTDESYISLSSVKVENLTQHWSTELVYPDTVIQLNNVTKIDEGTTNGFSLQQNTPNPFYGSTEVILQIPNDESVEIKLYNLNGQECYATKKQLAAGIYHLHISVSTAQVYLLHVSTPTYAKSIKMIAQQATSTTNIQINEKEGNIKFRKAGDINGYQHGDVMKYTATCYIGGSKEVRAIYDTITDDRDALFTFLMPIGYALLDLYYDTLGNIEGIVWHLSDTIAVVNNKPYCKHGKILGLDEGSGMYSSYFDMKFAHAFDSLDGEANTDSLMKLRYDTTLSFPERLQAATWCRAKGPEWYMPAILEVLEFRVFRDTINYILQDVAGWIPFRGKNPEDVGIGIWSSTELDNAATEPSRRKAYFSSFGFMWDIGINISGVEHDYYGSIMIGEVYNNMAVRAVKRF
ncbi:MAG: T9SS type A sorting domain-containing protein [Bacteroidales bacterium]|nr:T9SS type A sorting domain-containing protein [Bacteroidales bacterium]